MSLDIQPLSHKDPLQKQPQQSQELQLWEVQQQEPTGYLDQHLDHKPQQHTQYQACHLQPQHIPK